ncbi:MAG: VOC family protein [Hyphomicrobiales bacterium]|nr:VOC family protein [Hyphomicrobiales bacterium]MCP4999841.1 VOC family protein [Hyphomicrobiales bacterium]
MIRFRYIVDNVDQAVAFYTTHLGFRLERQFGPAMAILACDNLHLLLAGPMASASRPMPDCSKPASGSWNRIVISVDDLADFVANLRKVGVKFRNDIIEGLGGN